MIRVTKKLLANTALSAGLLLTLAAVALDALGVLVPVERYLLDERIKRCQYFMPPPTDRLVHLDIDDGALETIGLWPWDRSTLAQIMDELAVARPAAVGLDLLFTEPQTADWSRLPGGQFVQVDHDQLFAGSLERVGTAVVPASFLFPANPSNDIFGAMRDALVENPELTEAQLIPILRAKGWGNDPQLHSKVAGDAFLTARRVAMGTRLRRELEKDPSVGDQYVRSRVLPKLDPALKTPIARLFEVQLTRARAAMEMRRFARKPHPGEPTAFPGRLNLVPIYPLVHAAGATAFVDYPPASDGRMRSVPLFVQHDGLLYPQMGLSLACVAMGTPLDAVRIEPGRVVVPRPGQSELAIPTRTLDRTVMANVARDVPIAADLPWFGGSDWEQMYNSTGQTPRKQHLSILAVWEACSDRRKLESSNAEVDDALLGVYSSFDDGDKVGFLKSNALPISDLRTRMERVNAAVEELGGFVPETPTTSPATAPATAPAPAATRPLSAEEQEEERKARYKEDVLTKAMATLRRYQREGPLMEQQLQVSRQALAKAVGGRAVLVGWIATASIADFVPTPLHAKCPGPVLHGVVFNSIMTGEVWRRSPEWVSPLITLAVGLFMTGVVAYFSPGRALLAAMALAGCYLVVNGLVLFDRGNLIVGAAGPLTAVGLVWSGGTLTRLLLEQRQRALIRRRFRTYVDPRLVDYMEKHPEATFDGTNREMTVVFTDLVGFTKLTEALGEDTVKLLNELWAKVVPIVRKDGLLNKFLGDGVMFFYGAPEPTSDHAAAAIRTVLKLRAVMTQFNAEVTGPRGLPELGMRFGISTGHMIVGDAGAGEGGSDYTVLGDNVNLGSRLEGANKATGTTNLMTARTAELAHDQFLFRPVGSIRVVGKQQGVMTYEALCPLAEATEQHRQVVALSKRMADAYAAKDLSACITAAGELEALAGETKLAQLYRKLAERHLSDPDSEPFDGLITLSEK